jgi:hypothetical protein
VKKKEFIDYIISFYRDLGMKVKSISLDQEQWVRLQVEFNERINSFPQFKGIHMIVDYYKEINIVKILDLNKGEGGVKIITEKIEE